MGTCGDFGKLATKDKAGARRILWVTERRCANDAVLSCLLCPGKLCLAECEADTWVGILPCEGIDHRCVHVRHVEIWYSAATINKGVGVTKGVTHFSARVAR